MTDLTDPSPAGEPHNGTAPPFDLLAAARQCFEASLGGADARTIFNQLVPQDLPAKALVTLVTDVASPSLHVQNLLALSYERARQHGQALPHLRILREAYPANAHFTFRLAQALSRTGSPAEAMTLLDALLAIRGDDYWVQFERGQALVQLERDREAYRCFQKICSRWPGRPFAYLRCLDLAMDLRLWTDAAALCETITDRFPKFIDQVHPIATLAASYKALAASPGSHPAQGRACVFINLDRDESRAARMRRWYGEAGVDVERLSGVNAAALPQRFLLTSLAGAKHPAGLAGCFLSHVKAWELVLERNIETLILEDDAFPTFDLAQRLETINPPPDYDICFVNESMCPSPALAGPAGEFTFHSVAATLQSRPPGKWAFGTQGYLLSPKGAAKLLDCFAADGIRGHTDWQLTSYALTARDLEEFDGRSILLDVLRRFVDAKRAAPAIAAYCCYPHLVRHRDLGVSARRSAP